jgi:TonB family protein
MDLLSFSSLSLKFLLACTIKSSLLLGLAWFATILLRGCSAALRHRVWASGIVGSLALPVFMFLLPVWQAAPLAGTEELSSAPIMSAKAGLDSLPAMIINARLDSPLSSKLVGIVVGVWTLGFVFVALRLAMGLARVGWASNSAKPETMEIWLSCVAELCRSLEIARPVQVLRFGNPHAMPITWGFLKPRVLTPGDAQTWPESRVRIVLSHELAHIARHDWTLQIAAQLACSVYWFNPLMWIAARILREESERACDDAVLSTGVEPVNYAAEILELARSLQNPFRGWSAALAIARTTDLERRFKAILNPSIDRRGVSRRTRLLTSLIVLGLLLPLAAITLPGQSVGGKLAGTIHGPSGAAVGNATVILADQKTNAMFMTASGAKGNFVLKGLPYGEYELKVMRRGFEVYRTPRVLLEPGRDISENISLQVAADSTGTAEAAPGGASGQPDTATEGATTRVRVEARVQASGVVDRVIPVYPQSAKSAGVHGSVTLDAIIGIDGQPKLLRVVNTEIDPELARSAIEAVSKWRYRPLLVNGKPVEVETTVTVVYSLAP